jgi:hypothetical protein
MTGLGGRFDPSELRATGEPDPSVATLGSGLATARELEGLVAAEGIRPSEGFDDRIMAAIAMELAPRAMVRPSAGRGGRPAAFLLAVRDAWAIARAGGRPIGVRAQAMAFVLVVVLAAGSLAAVGAVAVGGLLTSGPPPSPSLDPAPSTVPNRAAPPPTETAHPTGIPVPGDGAAPTATPESTGTASPRTTPRPDATPRAIETPGATETPRPTETPESSDDLGGAGGSGSGGSVPDPD